MIARLTFFSRLFYCVLLILAASSATLAAQPVMDTSTPVQPANPYGSGIGMGIALNNSGFGLNFMMNRALSSSTSFTSEISIRSEKDEQEQKFFDYFGNSLIPFKLNYMLLVPVEFGIHKRLFSESIEDSFRPFVQAGAGPSLGYLYPYFNDANQNQEQDQGERTYDSLGSLFKGRTQFGVGGSFAVGAQFGKSRKTMQAIRVGYNFQYFFDDVQLMEPQFKEGQKFFGTPTITLIFGRLR